MGGRKPTPPTIIMPAEQSPQAYQTVIPQRSFRNLAERMGRMDTEYNRLLENRYDSVGTASEIGARARGRDMMEDASYLSSIPNDTGTTDFLTTPTAFPIKSNDRGTFDTVPGSLSGFGDERVFIERYVEKSRHIEIQILGDSHGNVIHLGERECSIQRRHQKIIEESPSPRITEEIRFAMGNAAVDLEQKK